MVNLPKVPRRPTAPLTVEPFDLVMYDGPLWRIHRTTGPHVAPWDHPRFFGPLAGMRFDPHPDGPPADHRSIGVHYNATDLDTAAAEVFQRTRVIDPITGSPYLTGWTPTRPLSLLDLTGRWLIRNGAAAALTDAPRSTCRAWARAIHTELNDLDGLYVRSTMTGAANVVLWARALAAAPAAPQFHRPLTSPAAWAVLVDAAARIGYRLS